MPLGKASESSSLLLPHTYNRVTSQRVSLGPVLTDYRLIPGCAFSSTREFLKGTNVSTDPGPIKSELCDGT